MNKNALLGLAGILAALLAALWATGRFSAAPAVPVAGRLLERVDWTTLRAVSVSQADRSVRMELADGAWGVAEMGGHPVQFDRLRQFVQALADAETGARADAAGGPAAFGLAEGGESAPVEIVLEHARGATRLRLGDRRRPRRQEDLRGSPLGRYAQVDGGPVWLLKDDLFQAQADPDLWWERLLLAVEPRQIARVAVAAAGESYALRRGDGDAYELEGADGETVDAAAADRLFGALRDVRTDRLLAETDGVEEPRDAIVFVAETEGAVYRLRFGAPLEDSPGNRPLRIEAEGDAAAARRFAGRAFRVPSHLAGVLGMPRGEIVRPAQTEPEPEAAPDAAPDAETEANWPPVPLPLGGDAPAPDNPPALETAAD